MKRLFLLVLPMFCLGLLSPSLRAHESAEEMAATAGAFLASLDQEQTTRAVYPLTGAERENWVFVPKPFEGEGMRRGLTIKEMRPDQRHLAYALLSTGLSHRGYITALQIMSLEQILWELENNSPRRDTRMYYLTIFGDPAGVIGHDLTNLGSGDLRCCWDEYHQRIHVATSTRVGSVDFGDSFHAGTTELTATPGSFGSVLLAPSPHGTTLIVGTTRTQRSTDGGVTWTLGPRYGVDLISPSGTGGETISVWYSEYQARWYMLTHTTSTVGFDLWESFDDGETWSWSADLADALGGVYDVCGAGPNRTRATRIRQFVVFPVASSTSSVRGLLIFDESAATVRVLPFGNTGITFIGEAGGQLVIQTSNDEVFTSIGSSVPTPLRKLP